MNFLKKAWEAIKNFEQYGDFALEKTSTVFSYFIKLMLVFACIVSVVLTYRFSTWTNQAMNYFKNDIPELEFKDQQLQVQSEEAIMVANEKSPIPVMILDTMDEPSLEEHREKIDLYGGGVLILKDRIVIRNDMLANEIVYDYKTIAENYKISDFDKEMVVEYVNSLNPVLVYVSVFFIIFLYTFMVYFITTLLDAVMLGVLAWILARIANIKMKFQNGFHIGVYALTLPIVLNMIYVVVNQLTGFTITYFQWMYSIISYIYVFIAILMIRTDLIHRQLQLIELQKEQQKVREELRQKEEKKKEEQPKEKEKEDKKEQPSEEPQEEQPDGSEA